MSALSRSRPPRGFALIELVIVLLLVSVLVIAAGAGWPGGEVNLDAQAQQLAGDIRYVQSLSMSRGQRFRINFFNDRYNMSDRAGATIAHPVVGVADVMFDTGITLATTNNFLVFNGKGVPHSDAALPGTPLGANAVVTLTRGADSRTLTVSRETGRVLVQ